MDPDAKTWLRTFKPAPGAPRVYCLPHAGGSASSYLTLARAAVPEVEVVAVQYPGRLDRFAEPPLETVEELADPIAAILAREEGPVNLFGHSMGSLIAFEVARRLPAVGHLFLSGAVPPPLYALGESLTRNGDAGPDDDALLEEIRGFGGTQAELLEDESILELILPVLRADYRALIRYRPDESRVAAPLTVLIGDRDHRTPPEQAARWAEKTTATTTQHVFEGGHFFLHDHPREIAEIITKALKG